jgi:mRNA interferase HicA
LQFAQMCAILTMNGSEFEKRIKKVGRRRGVPVSFDRGHGKGSHGRLRYGDRFTTLKDRKKEIGPGLLIAMLDQLGLTRKDLEQ